MLERCSITGEGVDSASGGGDIAPDLNEDRESGWRAVARTGLQRVRKFSAPVGRQRFGGAVAREIHRVLTAGERIAAQGVQGRALLPARLDFPIRAKAGGRESWVHKIGSLATHILHTG